MSSGPLILSYSFITDRLIQKFCLGKVEPAATKNNVNQSCHQFNVFNFEQDLFVSHGQHSEIIISLQGKVKFKP